MDPPVRLDWTSFLHDALPIWRPRGISPVGATTATSSPVMIGVSATGLTVTFRLAVVDEVGRVAPSCEVAVRVRAKSPSEFAGGVKDRRPRVKPKTCTVHGEGT